MNDFFNKTLREILICSLKMSQLNLNNRSSISADGFHRSRSSYRFSTSQRLSAQSQSSEAIAKSDDNSTEDQLIVKKESDTSENAAVLQAEYDRSERQSTQSQTSLSKIKQEQRDSTKSILKKLSVKSGRESTNSNRSVKEEIDGEKIKAEPALSTAPSKASSVVRLANSVRKTKLRFLNVPSHESVKSNQPRRVTKFFQASRLGNSRRSSSMNQVVKFQPSYRLESHNPFNARDVDDILKKIVDKEMRPREMKRFYGNSLVILCRELSESILDQVKAKNYDRYRILVAVNVGEKKRQSYRQNVMCVWDAEKDSMATYCYERPDVFVIATVFGVYYD